MRTRMWLGLLVLLLMSAGSMVVADCGIDSDFPCQSEFSELENAIYANATGPFQRSLLLKANMAELAFYPTDPIYPVDPIRGYFLLSALDAQVTGLAVAGQIVDASPILAAIDAVLPPNPIVPPNPI